MQIDLVLAVPQAQLQRDSGDRSEPGGGGFEPRARGRAYQAVRNCGPEQGQGADRREIGLGLLHEAQALAFRSGGQGLKRRGRFVQPVEAVGKGQRDRLYLRRQPADRPLQRREGRPGRSPSGSGVA